MKKRVFSLFLALTFILSPITANAANFDFHHRNGEEVVSYLEYRSDKEIKNKIENNFQDYGIEFNGEVYKASDYLRNVVAYPDKAFQEILEITDKLEFDNVEETTLEDIKAEAIEEINSMEKLSENTKKAFIRQIELSDDESMIEDILKNAEDVEFSYALTFTNKTTGEAIDIKVTDLESGQELDPSAIDEETKVRVELPVTPGYTNQLVYDDEGVIYEYTGKYDLKYIKGQDAFGNDHNVSISFTMPSQDLELSLYQYFLTRLVYFTDRADQVSIFSDGEKLVQASEGERVSDRLNYDPKLYWAHVSPGNKVEILAPESFVDERTGDTYQLKSWNISGIAEEDYTIEEVDGNEKAEFTMTNSTITFAPVYEKVEIEYTISFGENVSKAKVNGQEITSGAVVEPGSSVELTAKRLDKKEYAGWDIKPENLDHEVNALKNTVEFKMPEANVEASPLYADWTETIANFNIKNQNGTLITTVSKKAPVTFINPNHSYTFRLSTKDLPAGYQFAQVNTSSVSERVAYGEVAEIDVIVKGKPTKVTVSFNTKIDGRNVHLSDATYTADASLAEYADEFQYNGDGTLTYTVPEDRIPEGYKPNENAKLDKIVDEYKTTQLLVSLVEDIVDKEELSATIARAESMTKADTTSEDGTDVVTSQTWVSPQVQSDFDTALASAKSIFENSEASQEQVDESAKVLSEAIENYEPLAGSKADVAVINLKFVDQATGQVVKEERLERANSTFGTTQEKASRSIRNIDDIMPENYKLADNKGSVRVWFTKGQEVDQEVQVVEKETQVNITYSYTENYRRNNVGSTIAKLSDPIYSGAFKDNGDGSYTFTIQDEYIPQGYKLMSEDYRQIKVNKFNTEIKLIAVEKVEIEYTISFGENVDKAKVNGEEITSGAIVEPGSSVKLTAKRLDEKVFDGWDIKPENLDHEVNDFKHEVEFTMPEADVEANPKYVDSKETIAKFILKDESGTTIDTISKEASVLAINPQSSYTIVLKSDELPTGYQFADGDLSVSKEVPYGEVAEVEVAVKEKPTQVRVSFQIEKDGNIERLRDAIYTADASVAEFADDFVDNGDGTLTYTVAEDRIPEGYKASENTKLDKKLNKYGKEYLIVTLVEDTVADNIAEVQSELNTVYHDSLGVDSATTDPHEANQEAVTNILGMTDQTEIENAKTLVEQARASYNAMSQEAKDSVEGQDLNDDLNALEAAIETALILSQV